MVADVVVIEDAARPVTVPQEGEEERVAVNTPRPCVAAAKMPSLALYCNISVRTLGNPVSGLQLVDEPLISEVCQIPVSVAIMALVLSPG